MKKLKYGSAVIIGALLATIGESVGKWILGWPSGIHSLLSSMDPSQLSAHFQSSVAIDVSTLYIAGFLFALIQCLIWLLYRRQCYLAWRAQVIQNFDSGENSRVRAQEHVAGHSPFLERSIEALREAGDKIPR